MKNKKNRGFSLVELLIAMVILSLIMVGIASFASSTTSTYVRTKADVEIQESAAQTMDMISDKIMQAKVVRIGVSGSATSGALEYCSPGDHQASSVDSSTGKLLDASGSDVLGSGGRKAIAFHKLNDTAVDPNDADAKLQYIAVLYDTNSGSDKYKYMLDVYRFQDDCIYLYRYSGAERVTARESTAAGEKDPTEDELDVWMDSWIKSTCDNTVDYLKSTSNQHLICSDLESVDLYASPNDNSIFLTMSFKNEKRRAADTIQSMITLRNSYVLQPKGYKAP